MKFSSAFSLLTCLFLFVNLHAQNTHNNIDSITGIYKLIHNNEKEEIIVQTDRKIYIAGEKIWFKAFVVNGINNRVNTHSKNLFTDLVDDRDSIITKLVLNDRALNTDGAFTLPDSLKSGFYWIRCYTAKILAEDTESIFVQPVYILNKRLHDESVYNRQYINMVNKGNHLSPVIHFFAERLTGIPTIISTGVLQIMDANGTPLNVSGNLVNNNDSVITNFTTNHFGLARITFLDNPGEKYTAIVHLNGHDIKYTLPLIDHAAAQLSVTNQTAKSIKVFVTIEDSLSSDLPATILGVHGDSLCYAAVGTGTYGITIPLDNFPGGISSFLLFDQQQHLLAERKIFIPKDNYQLEIKPNKNNYLARDSAILNISVTNTDGIPLETSLNISVQDVWLTQLADSIEINNLPPSNNLLLNNWLTLYHGNYSPVDIDLLMMTIKSSYRHPVIDDTTNKDLGNDEDQKILNFTGKITDRKDMPVKDRVVTALAKNQNGLFAYVDTTKNDGVFKIPVPQNIDSLSFSLQVKDKYGIIRTDDNITVDTFNFPQFVTPVSLKKQFISSNINLLASMRKYHIDTAITFQGKGWLAPVIVKTVVNTEPNYDVSKRINSISQILTSDKFRYGGYNAVTNALLMVPGITMSKGDISIWGAITTDKESRPLLVVNGVATGYANLLEYFNDLQPADIDFIEVLRGGEAGIYGNRAGNGVISVNTRKGPPVILNQKSNFRVFNPFTYHVNPPFVMPDYSNPQIKNNTLPDPRTTIYWHGNLITDSTGKATVNFYTADNKTNYAITVTGLSAKGDIIYKRISISRN